MGDSAGANLVAATALSARDDVGPSIGGMVLLYPPLAPARPSPFASHRANDDNPVLSSATMAWFWDQYVPDDAFAADPRAHPLLAESLAGLPPTLVVTAGLDVLHDEGVAFARRLEEADVPTTLLDYAGVTHGFFWMDRFLPQAQEVVEDVARHLFARRGPSVG